MSPRDAVTLGKERTGGPQGQLGPAACKGAFPESAFGAGYLGGMRGRGGPWLLLSLCAALLYRGFLL